jgi:hypothetical protein
MELGAAAGILWIDRWNFNTRPSPRRKFQNDFAPARKGRGTGMGLGERTTRLTYS